MTRSNVQTSPWAAQPADPPVNPWYLQNGRSEPLRTESPRHGTEWSSPFHRGPAVSTVEQNASLREADDRWEAALARLNALREETHRRRMEYEERHRQQQQQHNHQYQQPSRSPQGKWPAPGHKYTPPVDPRRHAATPPPGRSESAWNGRTTPTSTPATVSPSETTPGYSSPRAQSGSRYDVVPVGPPALAGQTSSFAEGRAQPSAQQQAWDDYWRKNARQASGSGGNERLSRDERRGYSANRATSAPRTKPSSAARTPLPEDWTEEMDPASGHVFYHNHRTGVSQWELPPTRTTPEPPPVDPAVPWWRSVGEVHSQSPRSQSPAKAYNRTASMDWSGPTDNVIAPQDPQDRGKYVVVLDLDETIVYAREGPLVIRPGAVALIDLLVRDTEVVVWTAGERDYAQQVLREIDRSGGVRHCIYRHPKWFTGTPGQLKDLRLLGRDLSRVLVVENTPDCVRRQSDNAVLVPDYYGATEDSTLVKLGDLVRGLLASGLPVSDFLRQSGHMVQLRSIRTDLGEILNVHCLGDVRNRGPNLDMRQT